MGVTVGLQRVQALMTYSISGWCPATGEAGFAMASFDVTFAPPERIPSAVVAGVGSVACQAMTRPGFGAKVVALLQRGRPAAEGLAEALRGEAGGDLFQVAVVDAVGGIAAFTGSSTMAWAGHTAGLRCVAAGNLLRSGWVVDEMVARFQADDGEPLPRRLLAALHAGYATGGDRRGTRSATLRVAGLATGELYLRVQHHHRPLAELERLLELAQREAAFTSNVQAASRLLSPLLVEHGLVEDLASLSTAEAIGRLREDVRAQALMRPPADRVLDDLVVSLEGTHESVGRMPFRVALAALGAGLLGS